MSGFADMDWYVITAPNSMKLFCQGSTAGSFFDELLHCLQFVDRAAFKSTGVVKYELGIAPEDHFVIDIMQATLYAYKRRSFSILDSI